MASGASLQAKAAAVLAKVNATDRVISLRTTTTTSGNATLGINVGVSYADQVLDPQPAIEQLTAVEVVASGGQYQLGDYRLTISGAIDEATLRTSTILYGDEVLKIYDSTPQTFQGVVVVWVVLARSVKPGS